MFDEALERVRRALSDRPRERNLQFAVQTRL
jgi:hypothetical protein